MMSNKSLCNTLNSYTCILNPEKVADIIEEVLKEKGYDLSHLLSCFVYNREDEIEISLLTSPNLDIKIKLTK